MTGFNALESADDGYHDIFLVKVFRTSPDIFSTVSRYYSHAKLEMCLILCQVASTISSCSVPLLHEEATEPDKYIETKPYENPNGSIDKLSCVPPLVQDTA